MRSIWFSECTKWRYKKSLVLQSSISDVINNATDFSNISQQVGSSVGYLNISEKDINTNIFEEFKKNVSNISTLEDMQSAVDKIKQFENSEIYGTKGLNYGQIYSGELKQLKYDLQTKSNKINKSRKYFSRNEKAD